MPFALAEEECGKWWFYWWTGPAMYIHLVDVEVPQDVCDVVLPASLLRLSRGSIPVACIPPVFKVREGAWFFGSEEYVKAERLARRLARMQHRYWCPWAPAGPVPPAVYDAELLAEALEKMPVLRPTPEELAVDYVDLVYGDLAEFLSSEFVYLYRAHRKEERWLEICPAGDPRLCYPGALGARLWEIKSRGLVPAVHGRLFGKLWYARPWGEPHVATKHGYVYYVLGRLLRTVLAKRAQFR